MDTQITLILLTVLGAIVVAILGWIDSGEPFNPRKFGASMIRAVFAGFISALIFQGTTDATTFTYLCAFLIGAGVDVTGHRIAGAYDQLKSDT